MTDNKVSVTAPGEFHESWLISKLAGSLGEPLDVQT